MNCLLIVLCVVGWALYIVHTNSNTGGELVAQNAHTSAAPSPIKQASATSIGSERHPTASAAVRSSHAISPDDNRSTPATNQSRRQRSDYGSGDDGRSWGAGLGITI